MPSVKGPRSLVGARGALDPDGSAWEDSRMVQESGTAPGRAEVGHPVGSITWDPVQYSRFAAERALPFRDLISRVDVPRASLVVDLGCGPGAQTVELAALWPQGRVIGVDNSPDMLRQARGLEVPGRVEFCMEDIQRYRPPGPVDVMVTNATLQWVPGHLHLLGRLAALLAPGGVLGLQVPANFNEPSHLLLRELAGAHPWRGLLQGRITAWPSSHEPSEYLEALERCGLEPTVWETTYLQVLEGEDSVLEWMKGTALRPVLSALAPEQADQFLAEYKDRLRAAYPPRSGRVLLRYRRVFAVGRREP